jgi:DNA-binding HxlR family transcriptional regulator
MGSQLGQRVYAHTGPQLTARQGTLERVDRRCLKVLMVNARRTNPITECPLTAALAAIGGKWKLVILNCLVDSPRHFSALRQLMPDVSQKVLSEQLRELIADEIVQREETGKIPSPVIYSLTEYGRTVLPLLRSIRQWGDAHIDRFSR